MTFMRKLSMFAVGIALAIGCGKKDPVDEVIAGLEKWKTTMCACKDKACADKVHEDYKKWENDVLEPKMKGMDEKSIDKSKMCACKDKACADKVHEEYKKWENDVLEPSLKGMDEKSMDKGKMEKADKADDARKDCRRKFDAPEPAPGGEAAPPAP